MSFLSFLSSHRLHGTNRPWVQPLPMQLDILLHDQVPAEQIDHEAEADRAVPFAPAPAPASVAPSPPAAPFPGGL